MLSPNPYMALSNALGFSTADLNANRMGELTPYQRGMLSGQRFRMLAWPVLFILLLAAVGYALQIEFIFIVFLGACLVTSMVATWQRFQEDLESNVESIVGLWSQRTAPLGRPIAIINGQTFNIPKPLTSAFIENVRYRLYYTPGTRTILSAEII